MQIYADGFELLPLRDKILCWHLAAGGDRRPRHLLRPALRARPDDAAGARGGGDASRPHAAGRARVHLAIHEAVLDPHGPVQQPDRAEVRAVVHAGGVRGGRARGGPRGREPAARGRRIRRCPARAAAPAVLRPRLRADRHEQDAGQWAGHPRVERQQPLRRRHDGRPGSIHGALSAELAPGEDGRRARRRGVPRRRPILGRDRADRGAPRGGNPVRHRRHGRGARRARAVLSQRRDRRSARVRHRVGRRPGVARGHDERLHRGLHGRARREGRVGSARLLRAPGEDGGTRRRSPSTRSGSRTGCRGHPRYRKPQRDRRHRPRDRSRHRDRRRRADDADRRQPAERPGDSRDTRQQVGVALERHRGVREVHAALVPRGVRLEPGRGGSRRALGGVRRAS